MFRDRTCAKADELRYVERSLERQRSERRQCWLQHSQADADSKRRGRWTRFVGLRGRTAAVGGGLGDGAPTIVALVIRASCALFAARTTSLRGGLPACTLHQDTRSESEDTQDGGKPTVPRHGTSRMLDIPAGVKSRSTNAPDERRAQLFDARSSSSAGASRPELPCRYAIRDEAGD